MATKAVHLKRDVQDLYITVDQLFEAAFGPSAREYRHKSLLGWRPVRQAAETETFRIGIKPRDPDRRPPAGSPGVKIYETDELIVVEVELPPIDEESLYLEISGDLLIIRGNQAVRTKQDHPGSSKQGNRKVYRYVKLPVPVRPGEVRARLEGGTIRVMINKQK